MKAISNVIATLLMLIITVALAGVAWLYISGVLTSRISYTFSLLGGEMVAGYPEILLSNDGTNPITTINSITIDGKPVNFTVLPDDNSLVGYWQFDEGKGTTAKDSSGNGNDGLLQNIYPLDIFASNPSLEKPWHFVAEQDANHRIERPDNWTVSYNFDISDKMLAFRETNIVRDSASAIHMTFLFTGATFSGYININNCDNKFSIDETKYLEGGNFQYAIKGPASHSDQTFLFYDATGHFLSRRWAFATDLDVDMGDGWRMKSYVWQPSSLDPNPPTQGGNIPYIPQGATYACFMQYFVWHGGSNDWEKVFDKFFIYQWTGMPTDEERISRASSGWIDGKFVKALGFDGINDYVEVPHSTDFDLTQLTMELWIKTPPSMGQTWRNILSKRTPGDRDFGFWMHSSDNVRVDGLHQSSARFGSWVAWLPTPLEPNTWHHVVMTIDSTGLQKAYVDGNLIDTYQGTAGNANNSYPVWIGRADNYWNGLIDEVRIYNRALSAEEIKATYQIGGVINPGTVGRIRLYPSTPLITGTHTVRVCAPGMCQTTYVYVS